MNDVRLAGKIPIRQTGNRKRKSRNSLSTSLTLGGNISNACKFPALLPSEKRGFGFKTFHKHINTIKMKRGEKTSCWDPFVLWDERAAQLHGTCCYLTGSSPAPLEPKRRRPLWDWGGCCINAPRATPAERRRFTGPPEAAPDRWTRVAEAFACRNARGGSLCVPELRFESAA